MHRWFVVEVVAAVGSRLGPEYGRTLHGPYKSNAEAGLVADRFNRALADMTRNRDTRLQEISAKAIVSVMWANATVEELRELWADHPFFANNLSDQIHSDQR